MIVDEESRCVSTLCGELSMPANKIFAAMEKPLHRAFIPRIEFNYTIVNELSRCATD